VEKYDAVIVVHAEPVQRVGFGADFFGLLVAQIVGQLGIVERLVARESVVPLRVNQKREYRRW